MRLNLSYSVDIEELLSEISILYMREKHKLETLASESHKVLRENYTDKNISEVLTCMDDYRRALASFDVKLSEMTGIIKGYASIKEQAANPTPPDVLEDNE